MTRTFLVLSLALLSAMALPACVGGISDDGGAEARDSELSTSARRARSLAIQQAAAQEGLKNSVLLAGIANSETGMAHCWSEARWACQGPASSSCNGGPVIAGAGDGACWRKQGGLGMFQFDAGTHNQTLGRYGRSVLTLEGNTWHGVNFIVEMVIRSRYISGVSTRSQALDWLNSVQVDGRNWDAWIKTVTHYYNGCVPGRCSVYNERYNRYASYTRNLFRELGGSFWDAPVDVDPQELETPTDPSPRDAQIANGGAIGLSWSEVSAASTFELELSYARDGALRHYHTWTDIRDNAFTVWPQINDAPYRWRVRACTFGTCSDWSTTADFVVGRAAPTPQPQPDPEPEPEPEPEEGLHAPGSVSPAGGTISTPSVELNWSKVAEATHYDVHFMYKRQGAWREYHTWTRRRGESFTVWPQADNTDYRWQVRACDATECSPYTPFETFFFNGL